VIREDVEGVLLVLAFEVAWNPCGLLEVFVVKVDYLHFVAMIQILWKIFPQFLNSLYWSQMNWLRLAWILRHLTRRTYQIVHGSKTPVNVLTLSEIKKIVQLQDSQLLRREQTIMVVMTALQRNVDP